MIKDTTKYPVVRHSKTLDETFVLDADGTIFFVKSFVKYTHDEWITMDGLDADEIRAVHNTKKAFANSTVEEVVRDPWDS